MRRNTGIVVLAISVVTLIGNGKVRAQGSALDRIRGNPALLARADVRGELSLTADQIDRVTVIDRRMRETIAKFRKEAIAKFDALPEGQRRERQREVGATMRAYAETQWDEADKRLRDVLSADQMARFKQLDLQHRRASAFREPAGPGFAQAHSGTVSQGGADLREGQSTDSRHPYAKRRRRRKT